MFNINLEQQIEEVENELKGYDLDQEHSLETLDKIHKLKERHAELVAERDEQLNNVLETAKNHMMNIEKLADKVQPYLDRISALTQEIESGKYSVKYNMELQKEVDDCFAAIYDLHAQDLEEKQKAVSLLYSRYRSAITTKAKDVSPTEAMLIKEELQIMNNEELQTHHANNRGNEVIRRLAEVEMKRRKIQELPDISPVAKLMNTWVSGVNADMVKRSAQHGITYFIDGVTGVVPKSITTHTLKNAFKNNPNKVTLADLCK